MVIVSCLVGIKNNKVLAGIHYSWDTLIKYRTQRAELGDSERKTEGREDLSKLWDHSGHPAVLEICMSPAGRAAAWASTGHILQRTPSVPRAAAAKMRRSISHMSILAGSSQAYDLLNKLFAK